jgi:DNA-binding response OmpR family regulator
MTSGAKESRHALLLDPETYVWDVVRYALRDGYRVSAAAYRSTALRILSKDPPDVIILELSPALGLGFAIYGLRRHIPVVMTTSDHDLARRLMRLGCAVLRKPHSLSELRDCVDDAVAHPDDNFLRHRTALHRIRTDLREREAVLRLFGSMRDEVLLALTSLPD